MNKNLFFFVLLTFGFFFPERLHAQSTFERYYEHFSGEQFSIGQCVETTADGGFTVLGIVYSDSAIRLIMINADAKGDTINTWQFDGSGFSFLQGEDGDFAVTGAREGRLLMLNLDGDFNPVWWNVSGEEFSTGRAVCRFPNQDYCFAGIVMPYWMPLKTMVVLRTNPQGQIIWERLFGGAGEDPDVHAMAATPDGGILVCGDFRMKNTNTISMGVMKISGSGDSLWTKTFRKSDQSRGYQVLPAHPDGYLLAGTDQPDSGPIELYLVRIDENGDTLWTRSYGGIRDAFALGATVTSDYGYAVAATRISDTLNGPDLYLMRFNEQGDTVWTRSIGGAGTQSGRSIQQTADRGFIITGYGRRPEMPESIYLVRTDSLGRFTPYSVENSHEAFSDIRIFPNPSNGFFRISATNPFNKIEISDMRGNTVKEIDPESESNVVWMPGADPLPPGVYLLKVFSGDRIAIKKIIII